MEILDFIYLLKCMLLDVNIQKHTLNKWTSNNSWIFQGSRSMVLVVTTKTILPSDPDPCGIKNTNLDINIQNNDGETGFHLAFKVYAFGC